MKAGLAVVLALVAAPVLAQQDFSKVEVKAEKVAEGIYMLTGSGGNLGLSVGRSGTYLIDDQYAPLTEKILAAIRVITPDPVRFVVNTHWHPDHTGGNELLARAGAVIVAHDDVRVRLATPQNLPAYETRVPASPRSALPVVTFDDTLTLHLNGDRLTLLHVPSAHSDGDVLAWWEDANVVHLGDVYYADAYPFVDVAGGGSLAGLVAAIETVLSRADAETVVVPGHGPVGGRADLAAYRDMLVTVGTRVRALVEQGRSADEVVAARPTATLDERYGKGGASADRFVRMLYEDLAARR